MADFGRLPYRLERSRGYEYEGSLWSPGYFRADLREGEEAALIASTESWDTVLAVDPKTALQSELQRQERLILQARPEAQEGFAAELLLAADQFIIRPTSRTADVAVAHAAGDDVRTVIAGYHWFTDWGRDTMISLEGLTLLTGRQREAGYLLRTFARYVKDGLIPNLFPEGEQEGRYHTADATLWYFHALQPLFAGHGRLGNTENPAADAARYRGPSSARHAVWNSRRSARWIVIARRAGISTHLDGCESRRLGRHAAPRESRGNQRAVVQRSCDCSKAGATGPATTWPPRNWLNVPSRRACRSIADSGRKADICST